VNFPNQGKKSTQAVARLIEKSGGPTDYLRISKLIYLADRRSILERGQPIVGGHYFSMFKGPTISEFMDLVNQRSESQWREMIAPRQGNNLSLQGNPNFSALSQAELFILDAVVKEFADTDTENLVIWCHRNCPEYEEVAIGNRKPIDVESILRAGGKTPSRIQKVLENAAEIEELNALLA
jgi:Protein of unknown function (DUF4065)